MRPLATSYIYIDEKLITVSIGMKIVQIRTHKLQSVGRGVMFQVVPDVSSFIPWRDQGGDRRNRKPNKWNDVRMNKANPRDSFLI